MRLARTLILALAAGVSGAQASDRWATLEAIHQLENPRNLTRPGPFGELGAYQFRSSTWRMHTAIPFERAHDREISDTVAVQHYTYLQRGLEAARIPATAYNIALAWNSGLGAVIARTSPRVAHTYAGRAANLASSFAGRASATAKAPAIPAAAPKPIEVITFAGIPAVDQAPTVSFQWAGKAAAMPRFPDFSSAFRGGMRVSLTE